MTNNKFKVTVLKCSLPGCWYEKIISKEIEVMQSSNPKILSYYSSWNKEKTLWKSDCQIL
jgi:hypothetical protein